MVKKSTPPADLLAPPVVVAFVPATDDLIDEILDAMIQMAPAFCAALGQYQAEMQAIATAVSAKKHHEYAGDRVSIPAKGSSATHERSARNKAIRADSQRGERMALLERRYGLGRTTLWKIITHRE